MIKKLTKTKHNPPSWFAARLIRWQKRHGRHHLPWQKTRDPYAVWLSEIMLQQTQVATVIPYYERFLKRFPDIPTLARARQDSVLSLWSGLGYYSRARNLHKAAQQVLKEHDGVFPRALPAIEGLPGIGRSTAAAISVFAFNRRHAILDGNVKRVLCRFLGIDGDPSSTPVIQALWTWSEKLLPKRELRTYTQAVMDLGAEVCTRTRPSCATCPLMEKCFAQANNAQGRLPAPKQKRARPHKKTCMLILRAGGRLLLVKRPAKGIWASLWSFPETPTQKGIQKLCREKFGFKVTQKKTLPPMQHAFTHYSLEILPVVLDGEISENDAGQSGVKKKSAAQWISPERAMKLGVPAPVKKLLTSSFSGPKNSLLSNP